MSTRNAARRWAADRRRHDGQGDVVDRADGDGDGGDHRRDARAVRHHLDGDEWWPAAKASGIDELEVDLLGRAGGERRASAAAAARGRRRTRRRAAGSRRGAGSVVLDAQPARRPLAGRRRRAPG